MTELSQRGFHQLNRRTKIPCPAGGFMMVRIDLAHEQFGELLKSLTLPDNWREEIRRKMVADAQQAGVTLEKVEQEKERLKLKRSRVLKQHPLSPTLFL